VQASSLRSQWARFFSVKSSTAKRAGRPTLDADIVKVGRVTVRLSLSQLEILAALSAKQGRTKSQVLTEALKQHLDQFEPS